MPSLSDISDVLSKMSDIAIMYKDGRDEAEEATMGTVTTVLPSPKLVDGQGNETPLTDRGYEVVLMVYDRECRKAAGAHIERARALADEAGLYGNGYAAELAAYLDGLS